MSKRSKDAAQMRDKILAQFKPGAWLGKAQIAEAIGAKADDLTYHLGKLIVEEELTATGSTSQRRFALHGTATPDGAAPPPKTAKSKGKRAAAKPAAPPKPAAAHAPRAAVPCNVTPFTPAMTADKRMVIVGGSEPLVFSPEQTQSIADLVFENFEAA